MIYSTYFFVRLLALAAMAKTSMTKSTTHKVYFNYTAVTGYFLQDEASTDSSTFDYTTTNFGLINRTYDTDAELNDAAAKTQWQRFAYKVQRLNANSAANVDYKVLFLGRHGQGVHNVAESYYGTEAWDCYWSMLDGNGTVTWADAHLTRTGIAQAGVANDMWAKSLTHAKVPAPQSYYTSPLDRCLETAQITFGANLRLPADRPFVPHVKELLRETIGVHTCDRRSSRKYITTHYPADVIESGFAATDPLWTPTWRETSDGQKARLQRLLDDVFEQDDSTWISMTSHSGSIAAILSVIDHRAFSLATGGVIPVLVRAEKETVKQQMAEGTDVVWTRVACSTTMTTATKTAAATAA